eukprot:g14995.t1
MNAMKRCRSWESAAISVMAAAMLLCACSPAACSPAAPSLSTLTGGWQHSGAPGRRLAAVRTVPRGIADAAVSASSRQKRATRTRHSRHSGSSSIDAPDPCDTGTSSGDADNEAFESSSSNAAETPLGEDSQGGQQAAPSTAVAGPRRGVRGSSSQPPPWRRILQARTTRASPGSEEHAAEPAAALLPGAVGAYTGAAAGYSGMAAAKSLRRSRGGGEKHLNFREAVLAGAVSRSIAHTAVHPAIIVKTLLQGRGTAAQLDNLSLKLLTRGSGAQFFMSLPHGAFNYATLELIMGFSTKIFPAEWRERAGPVLDFVTSGVATLLCSVISTPQIVIEDRIMTGMYSNLWSGVREISRTEGLRGFYTGWSANVSQKIPSYGLTWVFYQASKRLYKRVTGRAPTATESFALGAAAAGGAVCVMIPLDTVLTRVVTQRVQAGVVPYKGVVGTLSRIVQEEGLRSMYSSLPLKLISVVPAIGIQFGIYDYFRKQLLIRKADEEEEEEEEEDGLFFPPSVSRRLRYSTGTDDALARRLYLLEEELL